MDNFTLDLGVGLFATFFCVGSPLLACHIYRLSQRIPTTQRLANRARIGVMVLTCIALIAALSLVLFTIHPPSSKFAITFFAWLFLVSYFIFNWTSPVPPPPGPGWQRLRLFSLGCIVLAIGGLSFLMIDSFVGFLR